MDSDGEGGPLVIICPTTAEPPPPPQPHPLNIRLKREDGEGYVILSPRRDPSPNAMSALVAFDREQQQRQEPLDYFAERPHQQETSTLAAARYALSSRRLHQRVEALRDVLPQEQQRVFQHPGFFGPALTTFLLAQDEARKRLDLEDAEDLERTEALQAQRLDVLRQEQQARRLTRTAEANKTFLNLIHEVSLFSFLNLLYFFLKRFGCAVIVFSGVAGFVISGAVFRLYFKKTRLTRLG